MRARETVLERPQVKEVLVLEMDEMLLDVEVRELFHEDFFFIVPYFGNA